MSSFGSMEDLNELTDKLVQCISLFDRNNHPINLILSLNGGGQAYLSQILLSLLCPKVNFNLYGAYRKTQYFKNSEEINSFLSTYYFNSLTCDPLTYDDLVKEEHIINYGDNISDTLTETFVLLGKDYKEQIKAFKQSLKNPRKPTDIIVFTDGFSYSSADIFLKYFQYYGGGITVGYFSNPNLENKLFDSGLSPSITISNYVLNFLTPERFSPLKDKFNLVIPGVQMFYSPDNMSIPLEFEVAPVDEIVDIYEKFDDSYYDIFIQEAKKILEKYNSTNGCNKNNKKIVLVTSECDGQFGNKYTHGGYECGDDGRWTTKCVASYCDDGYIFDYNKSECIVDVCSVKDEEIIEEEEEEEQEEEKEKEEEEEPEEEEEERERESGENGNNKALYYILFIGGGVLLIVIIFLVIFIIYRKYKIRKSDLNTIEKIKLVENMEITDK